MPDVASNAAPFKFSAPTPALRFALSVTQGRRGWLRVVAAILVMATVFFVANFAVTYTGDAVFGLWPNLAADVEYVAFFWPTDRSWTPDLRAVSFLATVWILLTLSPLWLATGAAGLAVYGRGLGAQLGGSRFQWRHFAWAGAIWGGCVVAGLIASIALDLEAYRWQGSGAATLSGLTLIPLWLIQTGAEEVAFRGLFLCALIAAGVPARSALIIQAAIFAALHYDPQGLQGDLWPTLAYVGALGWVMGALTLRTGALAAAWGAHFASNIALYFLAMPSTGLHEAALYAYPPVRWAEALDPGAFLGINWGRLAPEIVVMTAVTVIGGALLLRQFRRPRLQAGGASPMA